MSTAATLPPAAVADAPIELSAQLNRRSLMTPDAATPDSANPSDFQSKINHLKNSSSETKSTSEAAENTSTQTTSQALKNASSAQESTAVDPESQQQQALALASIEQQAAGTELPPGWPNLPPALAEGAATDSSKMLTSKGTLLTTDNPSAQPVAGSVSEQLNPQANPTHNSDADAQISTLIDRVSTSAQATGPATAQDQNTNNPAAALTRTITSQASPAVIQEITQKLGGNTAARSIPESAIFAANTSEQAKEQATQAGNAPIRTQSAATSQPSIEPTRQFQEPTIQSTANGPDLAASRLEAAITPRATQVVTAPTETLVGTTTTTNSTTNPLSSSTTVQTGSPILNSDGSSAQAWSRHLEGSIKQMIQQGPRSMHLQMNPAELGRLHINVNIQDDVASLNFQSQHGFVKEMIEASLPQLRQSLANDGLKLGDIEVSQDLDSGQNSELRQEQEAAAWQAEQRRNQQQGNNDIDEDVDAQQLHTALNQTRPDSHQAVDYFA